MKFKVMKYGKERRTELLCKDKYKNYNYYVLNLGTHPTAYIEIPKENITQRSSINVNKVKPKFSTSEDYSKYMVQYEFKAS